jgi:hypothetical protein
METTPPGPFGQGSTGLSSRGVRRLARCCLSLNAKKQSLTVTSTARDLGAVRTFFTIIEDFLHDHQGRTFSAPGLTALAVNSEIRTRAVEGKSGHGDPPYVARFNPGVSLLRGGPLHRVLRTQVLRRGGGARTAPPVTGRLRSPPYHAAALASTTARRQRRAECAGRLENVIARAGTMPRIAQIGPSTRKGTRRSFLPLRKTRFAESIFGTRPNGHMSRSPPDPPRADEPLLKIAGLLVWGSRLARSAVWSA